MDTSLISSHTISPTSFVTLNLSFPAIVSFIKLITETDTFASSSKNVPPRASVEILTLEFDFQWSGTDIASSMTVFGL